MDRKKASKARQNAVKKAEALQGLVKELVAQKRELTPGKTTRLLVKCGKQNCRCTKGQKHEAFFLYVSRGGPLKRIWLTKKERARVQARSERYRSFRKIRSELNKIFKELIAHIDALEAALTVPYEKEA